MTTWLGFIILMVFVVVFVAVILASGRSRRNVLAIAGREFRAYFYSPAFYSNNSFFKRSFQFYFNWWMSPGNR